MGGFASYYKGDKKKKKKGALEKQAGEINRVWAPPQVEIVGKKGKKP